MAQNLNLEPQKGPGATQGKPRSATQPKNGRLRKDRRLRSHHSGDSSVTDTRDMGTAGHRRTLDDQVTAPGGSNAHAAVAMEGKRTTTEERHYFNPSERTPTSADDDENRTLKRSNELSRMSGVHKGD